MREQAVSSTPRALSRFDDISKESIEIARIKLLLAYVWAIHSDLHASRRHLFTFSYHYSLGKQSFWIHIDLLLSGPISVIIDSALKVPFDLLEDNMR